jgi:transcriptional regulator with XRE-family HTH domain
MTPDQFTAALDALGWKQTEFCRKTGLTKQTPSNWVRGRSPIPVWVEAYLGAMLDLSTLYRKYAAPLPYRAAEAADDATDDADTPPPARLAHLLPGSAMP